MTIDTVLPFLMIAAALAVLLIGSALAYRLIRAQPVQTQLARPSEQPHVEESVLAGLGQRLGVLEGTMASLSSQSAGSVELVGRVSKLEQQLPAIADAYEAFTDAFGRKDKRDGERARVAEGRTAADAAISAFGENAGALAAATAPNGPPASAAANSSEWAGAFVGSGRRR